ncbi:hypothetical protein V1509DRAFT_666531 [Lipomyces kononenkoae]
MCNWKTTDSARATSTSNMILPLNRHGIQSAGSEDDRGGDDGKMRQQSVATMFRKSAKDNVGKTLEQNLVRWIVMDDMAILAIESSAFQQNDLPGVSLPFNCPQTVACRIDSEFTLCRDQLVEELELTCKSIAMSLDVWTSKNSKAMLGVIGHWLTQEYHYREHVLEFDGAHTGENIADLLNKTLEELRIGHKLRDRHGYTDNGYIRGYP